MVWGNYGEGSNDAHELFDAMVESASKGWRAIGARNMAEAKGYFTARLRRT